MLLTTFSVFILCSLILSGSNVDANKQLSGLLSRLYRSAGQSNRPLVVIIDRSSLQENPRYALQPSSLLETSYENDDEVLPSVYLLQSENSPSQKRGPKKYKTRNRYNRIPNYIHKNRLQMYKGNKGQLRDFVTTSHSPVIKTLLRFKNDINCEANGECQEKCENRVNGEKQQDICKANCEEKFECESEPDDPCGEGSASEDCDVEDKDTSTKGFSLGTDKPGCSEC